MSRHLLFAACFAFSTLSLLACGPAESTVEVAGEDLYEEVEGALCSAKDTGGIAEGSAEAQGVLQVANTLNEAQLKSDVGLTSAAAKNVERNRVSSPYQTLAQLSAVCQVGNSAMGKLLAYAQSHNLLKHELPFAPCASSLTPVELQGLYGRASWLALKAERYTRSCNESAGSKTCTAWATAALEKPADAYASTLPGEKPFDATVVADNGLASIKLMHRDSTGYWASASPGATAGGKTALELKIMYRAYKDVCDDFGWNTFRCLRSHYEYSDKEWMTVTGTVSESCIRAADAVAISNEVSFGPGVKSWVESVRTLTSP